MMPHTVKNLFILIILSLTLQACGGSSPADPSPEISPEPTATPANEITPTPTPTSASTFLTEENYVALASYLYVFFLTDQSSLGGPSVPASWLYLDPLYEQSPGDTAIDCSSGTGTINVTRSEENIQSGDSLTRTYDDCREEDGATLDGFESFILTSFAGSYRSPSIYGAAALLTVFVSTSENGSTELRDVRSELLTADDDEYTLVAHNIQLLYESAPDASHPFQEFISSVLEDPLGDTFIEVDNYSATFGLEMLSNVDGTTIYQKVRWHSDTSVNEGLLPANFPDSFNVETSVPLDFIIYVGENDRDVVGGSLHFNFPGGSSITVSAGEDGDLLVSADFNGDEEINHQTELPWSDYFNAWRSMYDLYPEIFVPLGAP